MRVPFLDLNSHHAPFRQEFARAFEAVLDTPTHSDVARVMKRFIRRAEYRDRPRYERCSG